jgi:glutaredoxin
MMFIVYGGEKCSYCTKAKMLLDMREKEYQYYDIYNQCNGAEEGITYRDQLFTLMQDMGLPLPRSIPQCFMVAHGELVYVGGFDALKKYVDGE